MVWELKQYGAHLSLEKDGHAIAHTQGGLYDTNPDVVFLKVAVLCHDELLDACKAVDIYFKALQEQWTANDGNVISKSGTVIDASKDVQRLCEVAAQKVQAAIAKVGKK